MLLLLAPRGNQKSQDKVSENELLDEAKVVTIGVPLVTKGKKHLFDAFDEFPSGSVHEFVLHLSTSSDFAFFDKRGNRLCLHEKASRGKGARRKRMLVNTSSFMI
jgi:hypothetical protein